jgi:HEAT repeat protein
MRRTIVFALLALALGCGRDKQPLTSSGKPVSHWVEALKDPDPQKRKKAVKALGAVGAADPAAIPALVKALKDPDPRVRAESALALLNVGPAAKEAIPALEEACRDRDATVRDYAGKAISRIRNGAPAG